MAFADKLDKLVGLYVDRPCTCFGGGCATLLLLTAVAVMSGAMTMTLDQESAWAVHSGHFTQNRNAWYQARDMVSHERRLQEGDGPKDLLLMYKAGEGNTMFTPQILKDMCIFEGRLFKEGDTAVCDAAKHEQVRCPAFSPISIFYGDVRQTVKNGCPLLDQSAVDTKVKEIAVDVAKFGSSSRFAPILSSDFHKTNLTMHLRSTYRIQGTDAAAAEDYLKTEIFASTDPPTSYGFLRSAFQGDDDRMVASGSIRVRYFYEFDEFMLMLPADFSLAICSMIFVFATMYLHLGSFYLAAFGMWQIVASLPIGALFYRKLFMVDYFEFLHILVVYLVLGVGADDIFVLLDSWRHVKAQYGIGYGKPEGKREAMASALKETWVRTAGAIFNTSFTTGVAFMSMSVSGVMPMKTCGWFASIAIILNYIFTIFFTPSLLMVYQYYFCGKRCCCPHPFKPVPAEKETVPAEAGGEDGSGCFSRLIERFLHKVYLPNMQRKVGGLRVLPLAFVLIMTAVGVQGAIFASMLTPPSKSEEWFPQNHMWLNLGPFISETFYSPDHDRYDRTTIVWGIAGMNFDEFNQYKPDDFPAKVEFDETFDISTAAAQQAYLDMCQKLRTLKCNAVGCRGGNKYVLEQGTYQAFACPLEDFQRWLAATQNRTDMPTGSEFLGLLKTFRKEADHSTYGENTKGMLRVDYSALIGFQGDKLKHIAIEVRSTMLEQEPYGTGVGVRSLINDFVQEQAKSMPDSMKSVRVAGDRFANFDLGQELVSGLFSGMAIAGPLVFLVLLLSTRNIVLALYAVISVAGIVVSVLGFCKSAMDYDLGVGEAIAGIIVIGYSVDYVVHFAHTYCEASKHGISDREGRATFTIKNMGSTVFAGALTTAGSGVFMFFCFLSFFTKMALLICMTIFYSFLFSLCFFMGLCFLVGPEGNFGSICCCMKKSESAPPPKEVEEKQTPSPV